MKITLDWLKKNRACIEGVEWFSNHVEKSAIKEPELEIVINALLEEDHSQWANWTLVRFLDRKQKIQYAVFAAEQVIDIFEKKYPNDKRPRKAIEAAKKCLGNDTKEDRASAYAAAYAAYAYAASAAAYAAYAAAYAAAAYAASSSAAASAKKKMREKILKYGLSLLKGEGL